MRTWWQLLRQRGRLGSDPARARRSAGIYISDRALRLAAEVLEPRCLLTDATGLAADDGGGDILVDASQWDDAGLTLLRDGDLVHLVRTGTTQDVIAPFAADAPGRLIIQGRDDASDVLTIDLSGMTRPADDRYSEAGLTAKYLQFDGGDGADIDQLRIISNSDLRFSWNRFSMAPLDDESHASLRCAVGPEYLNSVFDIQFRHVELATIDLGDDSGNSTTHVGFGSWDQPDDNLVTVDYDTSTGFTTIAESCYGTSIEMRSIFVQVWGGLGDDQITVFSSYNIHSGFDRAFQVFGDDGNDTLIGSDGDDDLDGGYGDDVIDGRGGDDFLRGRYGENVINGGDGFDRLFEFGSCREPVARTSIRLSGSRLEGFGTDEIESIEAVTIGTPHCDEGIRIDASAFPGPVTLVGGWGDDTLIGGAFDDVLDGGVGRDLLIGGEGHALLVGSWEDLAEDYWVGGGQAFDTLDGDLPDYFYFTIWTADNGSPIPNAPETLIDPPSDDMLLGQGLDESRDEDAILPEALVTAAESDGEDSDLNELDGQESNQADEDDSTETASTTIDGITTDLLLTDELKGES